MNKAILIHEKKDQIEEIDLDISPSKNQIVVKKSMGRFCWSGWIRTLNHRILR